MRVHLMLFLAAIPLSLSAQPIAGPRCDTSTETTAAMERLHEWNRRVVSVRALAQPSRVIVKDGTFIVPISSANAPLDHPNDLQGRSVHLVPAAAGFVATTAALQYDDDLGTMVMSGKTPASPADYYVRYDLKTSVPLFGRNVTTIYVSLLNGITLDVPKISASRQLDPLEALLRDATVAPLLMTATRPNNLSWPAVWVTETAESLTVTWRTSSSLGRSYDVQAKIASSGEIVLSYKSLKHVEWGSVVVTPGAVALAGGLTVVSSTSDPADDLAPGVPEEASSALDLRSVTIGQISGSTLLQIEIAVGSNPLVAALAPRDAITYTVRVRGVPAIEIQIDSAHSVTVTHGPVREPSGTSFTGNTIFVAALNETLGLTSAPTDVVVESSLRSRRAPADVLSTTAALGAAVSPIVDFSAANGTTMPMVAVQSFTLPVVDLEEVWEEVRSAAHLSDDSVDALAVWQDFDSEPVIANVAFAAGGNPGNEGVGMWSGYGRDFPRSPTLLNLSSVNDAITYGTSNAVRNFLHEFGHRWLFFLNILVNGAPSRVLDPRTSHPAQYVNTPAAFAVTTGSDSSVMGGGYFVDNGNGTFTSAAVSAVGFSWLDLYLMGLARPDEVPPSYYIDGAQPPLGLDYWPPSYITVAGTRRDFGVDDVAAAMGPRDPSYPFAQKQFTVYTVLVTRDADSVGDRVEGIRVIRTAFETRFATATGGRGSVRTTYAPAPLRRRVGSK